MKTGRRIGLVLAVLLFLACDFDSRAEGKEIVFEKEGVKNQVYMQLGKEEDSPLYEEELKEMEGQLKLTGAIPVSNGEELDVLRSYFRLENVDRWEVYFAPDLDGWTEEQLKGLGDLKQTVWICSEGSDTVPARVLPYFTGTEELYFEVEDVTGQMPEGKTFPRNVKNVVFDSYATARYRNLLKCMQGSGVEWLRLNCDDWVDAGKIFWLDEVAGCRNLEYLDLDDCRIRVWEAEKLAGMKLRGLAGVMDKSTDLSFADVLPSLEKVVGAVVEWRDLTPLLEKEELGLRLRFCQEIINWKEDIYPDGRAVVDSEWDEYFNWKEEGEEDGNFLAIYQRYTDEGRKAECFSVRTWGKKDGGMYPVRTFLRVTDGEKVFLLNPAEAVGPDKGFGEFQRDSFYLADINFDGVKDIILDRGSFGNQGAHYEFAWIWEEEQGEYVFSDSYTDIINPRVDDEHKLVRSSWRNWAASHGWAIYRYENGEFVCIGDLTEELLEGEEREDVYTPAGAEVWQWVERRYEDGRVAGTKSFTVTNVPGEETEYPEEYYRFYGEYSYWGG